MTILLSLRMILAFICVFLCMNILQGSERQVSLALIWFSMFVRFIHTVNQSILSSFLSLQKIRIAKTSEETHIVHI